jgi:hypothetical protein
LPVATTPALPGLCITIIFLVDVYLTFCFGREVVCANENHKNIGHFIILICYFIILSPPSGYCLLNPIGFICSAE